jgi:hypothetical protein
MVIAGLKATPFEPAAGAAGDVPRDAVFHGARGGIADLRFEISDLRSGI